MKKVLLEKFICFAVCPNVGARTYLPYYSTGKKVDLMRAPHIRIVNRRFFREKHLSHLFVFEGQIAV